MEEELTQEEKSYMDRFVDLMYSVAQETFFPSHKPKKKRTRNEKSKQSKSNHRGDQCLVTGMHFRRYDHDADQSIPVNDVDGKPMTKGKIHVLQINKVI